MKKKIPKEPEIKGSVDTAQHYASMDRWERWLKKYAPDRFKQLNGKP